VISFLGGEVFLEEKQIPKVISFLGGEANFRQNLPYFRILLFGLLVFSFNNLYSYFNHAL
jgi:hypothetical protein